MNVATQISGNIRPHSPALHAFRHMLIQLGIHVARPTQDEPPFYTTGMNAAWRQYNNELDFYEAIADSTFHIIHSNERIDELISQQILYAMLKNRPIVMTSKLRFGPDVSAFTRELIEKHSPSLHIVDLAALDLTELSNVLGKLKTIDYGLSNSERILIRSRVKSHFRKLLDTAKDV